MRLSRQGAEGRTSAMTGKFLGIYEEYGIMPLNFTDRFFKLYRQIPVRSVYLRIDSI
jgi:hypothetical protein